MIPFDATRLEPKNLRIEFKKVKKLGIVNFDKVEDWISIEFFQSIFFDGGIFFVVEGFRID